MTWGVMAFGERLIGVLERGVPQSLRGDVDTRRRALLVVGVAVTLGAFCLAFVIPVLIGTMGSPDLAVGVINTLITPVLASLAVVMLRRRDGLWLAGHWLALLLFAGSVFAAVTGGGIFSPFLVILLALPVIAGTISGRNAGWLWAVMSMLLVLTLAVTERAGIKFKALHPEVDPVILLAGSTIAIMAILTCFFALAEATRREAIARMAAAVAEEQRSRAAASEAIAASAAKSAFLATMSHELRTPLNIILGYSELVLEDLQHRGDGENADDVKRIVGAGEHLLGLISDILDLSRIEAERLTVARERFDLGELVRGLVIECQPLAVRGDTRLSVSTAPALIVSGLDHTRVRQILYNLVSNAIKFTRGGQVSVHVGRADDAVEIAVEDTGIGIPERKLAEIFQPFTQADQSTTRRYEGSGLGLAIARRLCDLMGGSLSVRSVVGRGSTFTVRFPGV